MLASLLLSSVLCSAEPEKKPLVFYLKNLPLERVGEYSDAKIQADLRADGFLVIEVDCSAFPRTSPQLEDALVHFHKNSAAVYGAYENADQMVDVKNVFYVPEGYTLTRNIPVWNMLEHGAPGSLEWIVDTWNGHIVSRFGKDPVRSAEQMRNPDGTALDWNLYMDIIHPSGKASRKVPLLLTFGSISPRMASFRPDRPLERVYRNIFTLGFLTTGYAFAITDHCYNPLARGESFNHFKQYTLDDFNAHASSTAFIRYLRTHLDQYNLNGKIGVMGISKASYSVVRVADRNNADGEESLLFGGASNERPQPWMPGESHVDVAYAAAGIGAERIFRYVNENTVPLITSAGMKDEYRQWTVYPDIVRYLQGSGHLHLSMWMEDMGHTFPCMGVDGATGLSRYVLFKRFFDHFLKAGSADVLYILPKEGAEDVDSLGCSRVIPSEEHLPDYVPDVMQPSAMAYFPQSYPYAKAYAGVVMRLATGEHKYVIFKDFFENFIARTGPFYVLASENIFPESLPSLAASAPITVRFLTEYSLDEISAKVRLVEKASGRSVSGRWNSSMKGTCFTFVPDRPLSPGVYRIITPSSLRSVSGKRPSNGVVRDFIMN